MFAPLAQNSLISAVQRFFEGSGSSDVCQVSVGPTTASPLDPSLDCRNAHSELPLLISIQMPLHTSVANCRLTVLLVHRISCAILGSQNALIKVGEVLRLWPAVIAILPSLEPQQLSNISRDYSLSLGQRNVFNTIPASELIMQTLHAAFHSFAGESQEPQLQSVVRNGALA